MIWRGRYAEIHAADQMSLTKPRRIAMWSGPRNISTAMMRSWDNRGDAVVWDEPLYAYYLAQTGSDHPGAEEVIGAGEPDWRKVVARLLGPVPDGKPVFFQKHMTHHLLPEVSRDWLGGVTNCFLIRDPREVIASYVRTRPTVTVEDVGIPQQAEIYDTVKQLGQDPVVLDAKDILRQPEAMLRALCATVDLDFSPGMLRWPPGTRNTDGIWGKYWYANVVESTGFQPYVPKGDRLPAKLEPLVAWCDPHYQRLFDARLQP